VKKQILLMVVLAVVFTASHAQPAESSNTTSGGLSTGEITGAITVWAQDEPKVHLPKPRMHRLRSARKQLTVTVEIVPNEQIRVFHFDIRVSDDSIARFDHPVDKLSEDFKRIGPVDQKLVVALMGIDGVVRTVFLPRGLHVEIGKAFCWHDVEKQVLRVIKDVVLRGKSTVRLRRKPESLKILSETTLNPRTRVFNANKQLSQYVITNFIDESAHEQIRLDEKRIGPVGLFIVSCLVDVPTVSGIFLEPYELSVTLKEGHAWTPGFEALVKQAIDMSIQLFGPEE
jgi:hypothetical protein